MIRPISEFDGGTQIKRGWHGNKAEICSSFGSDGALGSAAVLVASLEEHFEPIYDMPGPAPAFTLLWSINAPISWVLMFTYSLSKNCGLMPCLLR